MSAPHSPSQRSAQDSPRGSVQGDPKFTRLSGCPLEKLPREISRRRWVAGAASLLAIAGCQSESSEESRRDTPTVISDVPLRIVWVGSETEVDTIRRTWQSISEQPLDIRLAAPPQTQAKDSAAGRRIVDLAAKADVVVYPLTLMAELVNQSRLMPLLEEGKPQDESDVFVAVDRQSRPAALKVATSFSNEQRGLALGGRLPALMLSEASQREDKLPIINTWKDYHELAQQNDGKCGEPTAAGWAGVMFLWRLCSSLEATWLFDRETLQPLLTQPEYVDVLAQMSRTVKLSPNQRGYQPGEVHQAVGTGEMVAGVGFPYVKAGGNDLASEVSFADLPSGKRSSNDTKAVSSGGNLGRVMMNPFMLVGSLAASCRQTAAADQFLQWLAGGQGSEPVYRSIESVIDVRSSAIGNGSGAQSGYRSWLRGQLSNPNVVPALQLTGATQYYQALDENVRQCVHGETSAADACQTTADAWMELHREFDVPAQMRSWRRAQGIA